MIVPNAHSASPMSGLRIKYFPNKSPLAGLSYHPSLSRSSRENELEKFTKSISMNFNIQFRQFFYLLKGNSLEIQPIISNDHLQTIEDKTHGVLSN